MLAWFREVFSEDGKGSYTHVASACVVIATIAWVTYAMIKSHGVIPDLIGPASFLTTGVGIHQGMNNASEIIASMRGPTK